MILYAVALELIKAAGHLPSIYRAPGQCQRDKQE